MLPHQDGLGRHTEGAGRRPLVVSGPSRQMLQNINENLQHATRRHHEQQLQQQQQCDVGGNNLGVLSMHPELTQSTPNLLVGDKSKLSSVAMGAGAGGKPQDRFGYNQQALLEIRQSLQGFQITEEGGHGPVWHQPNVLTTDAVPPNKHFLQQLKDMGWDEGIACRALQISGNKSVDAAVMLMQTLSNNEGRNGFAKLNAPGLPRYGTKVVRKPSFEEKYHQGSSANSENSSVRSESPGMGSQRQFFEPPRGNNLQPPIQTLRPNERLTPPPPPVPPRGVPAGSLRKGYTPPPPPPPVPYEGYDANVSSSVSTYSMAGFLHLGESTKPAYTLASVPCGGDLVGNSAHYQQEPVRRSSAGQPAEQNVVTIGHVKQMIRRMSAPPTDTPNSRSAGSASPSGSGSIPGRHPIRPMESHGFLLSESHHMSCEETVHENSPGQSPLPIQTSNHQSPAQYGHGSQLLPDQILTTYLHDSPSPQASHSPSPASTPMPGHKLTNHMHIMEPQPATVQAWGAKQQAIITQQVKSREVAKPVLQTATAPQAPLISEPASYMSNHSTSPGPNPAYCGGYRPHFSSPPCHSAEEPYANYSSSMDSPVNYPSPTQTPPPVPPRTVQVDITQLNPQQYMVQGGPHFDLSFYSNASQRMHVTHYGPNGRPLEVSAQQPPLPPRSHQPMNQGIHVVPRTSSPAMRAQSPLSIISTTSTPSSNSDIPDKPPPPYPGRPSQPNPLHLPAQHYVLPDDLSSNSDRMSEMTATDSQPEQDTASDTSSNKSGLKRQFAELLHQTKLNQKLPPQAYKFYMEQHIENLMKNTDERRMRAEQLELEMSKVGLSEEAQKQMRRMLRQKESNYIRLKRAKMSRDMFKKINTLGVGAFGEVALVRKRDTEVLYAMKTLRKSDILQRNQAAHVKAERDILAEADNEWVVKLYYSFQDDHNLYFIMDYIPGGDLMSLLIKDGIFTHDRALFYIAELVQAIDSVHRMGFIHRDIKPDNILIDKDGHIKLTDFGLCTGFRWTHNSKYYQKGSHIRQDSMDMGEHISNHCHCGEEHLQDLKRLELRKARHQRCLAHSLVGTPNYIAPEVLLRRGYTACCDWWSVGVILYEMLVGKPPFYASDPAEIQRKVINWHKELQIPSIARLAPAAIDIIKRLCCDAHDRLGAKGTDEVKSHPFFHGIDWLNLRKQPASYVPVIRHPTDISNFDPVDPDKIRDSEDDGSTGSVIYRDRIPENGKQPDHAFYEFTFRRFFDEGGQFILPYHDPLFLEECDTSSENSVNTKEEDSSPVYV